MGHWTFWRHLHLITQSSLTWQFSDKKIKFLSNDPHLLKHHFWDCATCNPFIGYPITFFCATYPWCQKFSGSNLLYMFYKVIHIGKRRLTKTSILAKINKVLCAFLFWEKLQFAIFLIKKSLPFETLKSSVHKTPHILVVILEYPL